MLFTQQDLVPVETRCLNFDVSIIVKMATFHSLLFLPVLLPVLSYPSFFAAAARMRFPLQDDSIAQCLDVDVSINYKTASIHSFMDLPVSLPLHGLVRCCSRRQNAVHTAKR
jgi:hypothetical protein